MCDETLQGLLTVDECALILRNYTSDKNAAFTSHQIKTLSEQIEGMLGEHYIVTINYKTDSEKSQSFFMKVLNGSEVIFELSQSLKAFEKEVLFYECLRRDFENLNMDVTFSPRSYYSKPFKLVLENVALRGFKTTDKLKLFDLQHCKAALKCIAKFHASGICYEKIKNVKVKEKFGDLLNDPIFGDENNLAVQWMRCSVDGLLQLIQYLNISDEDKTKFYAAFVKFYKEDMYDNKRKSANGLNTIVHGDLWSNNFLFKYNGDVPEEGILIDYQIIHYGSVSVDVMHLVLTNARKELRDLHYNNLLEYYYEHLKIFVEKNNCSLDYDLSQFLESCKIIAPVSKLQAVADHTLTFMADVGNVDVLKSSDGLRKFLYDDRSKFIIDPFLTNKVFREIIEEDMLEFMDMLLPTS